MNVDQPLLGLGRTKYTLEGERTDTVKLVRKAPLRFHKAVWACAFLMLWGVMSASGAFADGSDLLMNMNNFGNKNTYGIGPRAMGMGGAFAAVADDASAVWWNPAGLVQVPAYTLALSSAPVYFQRHIPGRSDEKAFGSPYYESIQLVIPIAAENTIGLSLFRPFHPQHDYFPGSSDLISSQTQRKDASYLLNPSYQEDDIVFTYSARFSAARNFSMGVNVERITSDPYYIRYFGDDINGVPQALQNKIRVRGYGAGLGFLYRIPLTKYSQEVRIGLTLNDLVSRVQYLDPFNVVYPLNNGGVTYNLSAGYETQVPPEIVLGLAYKNNILFKVRNITALDFSQISDNRYSSNDNKSLRMGTEFWFLRDILGLRGGYSTPMSRPGTLHLGMSVRGLSGALQADLVYLHPVQASSELTGITNDEGINFEKFHFGLSYRFGSTTELPPPTVSAQVNPAAFVPAKGEKADFSLDTSTDVSIDRWSVLIYNVDGKLVRGIRGSGTPPTHVVWAGESDTYEPLPAGTYTWAFQVRDNLGHVGSTAVQTVELLGVAPEVAKDPRRLYNLRQQQAALLAQESQRLAAQAREAMKKLMANPEATPTTANANALASAGKVPEAAGNTTLPEAGGVPFLTARNLAADQVLNAHFDMDEKNERVVTVSYRSNLTYVPYIYQEASEVVKSTVQTVGNTVPTIQTRVYYGKNEMDLRTPSGVAADYANGRITRDQLVGLSDVRINGEKVTPNAL